MKEGAPQTGGPLQDAGGAVFGLREHDSDRIEMFVVRQLHVFARIEGGRPVRGAQDVLETSTSAPRRVLELFEAPLSARVVDLSLAERHLCEVISALHWAEEVHLHNVHPSVLFEQLPYVVPAVLEKTHLQVRGRWPRLARPSRRTSARLERWPGPVFRDAGTPPIVGQPSKERDALPPVLDLGDARYRPRACGAVPVGLPDGRLLARIGLSEQLDEVVRKRIRTATFAASSAELEVLFVDETEVETDLRAEARRAYQAFVTPALRGDDWPRPTLEALAQGLPVIALGDPTASAPPSVVFAGSGGSVRDLVRCVRDWRSLWERGESAPVDLDARRAWVEELVEPQGPRTTPWPRGLPC